MKLLAVSTFWIGHVHLLCARWCARLAVLGVLVSGLLAAVAMNLVRGGQHAVPALMDP